MKFRELEAGRVLTFGPARLTEDEILAFAREYDPQWFHTDPSRAKAGRWDGLIASGWHTAAIAMRLVVENVLAGSETFGSPGLEYLKWLAPVRPNDALTLRIEVLVARRSERKPTLGVVRWRWTLANQEGVDVLDLVATNLFDLGPS
ncbi:MAG TPA: MaoC family dehydratase [Casimicrobiaceae bacterium]|jgi:acyl dehydratase|nr:MaoC family dehydratase [Casimicrobiaceae bacterium]HWD34559.1 MaoC family dehydratase [Casimicrobiaceae bacterium]